MNREQLAASIAAVALVKSELIRADTQYRAELNALLREGAAEPAYVGDRRIGKVIKKAGALRAHVTDADELLRFVRQERPDEVVVTETVRELHVKHLLDRAKEGEVIPGIELSEGAPTLSLTSLDKTALGVVLAAVRAGDLQIETMPELTAGGAE